MNYTPNTPREIADFTKTEITEEVKTKLYNYGPQVQVQAGETVYFCPVCDKQLVVHYEQTSPDDYKFVAYCETCKERWDE